MAVQNDEKHVAYDEKRGMCKTNGLRCGTEEKFSVCNISTANTVLALLTMEGSRMAYLQNVTVFDKQVVSTDATVIKRSVCQSIATDLLA